MICGSTKISRSSGAGKKGIDRFLRFASWIEFLAVDYAYPEFDIWTQFVSDTLAACMIPDALQNSHAIEVPIEKPSDIDEIFDEITYEKGLTSSNRRVHRDQYFV